MADSNSLRKDVLTGIFWQYFQRIGNQLVHFVVSIILARLLVPEDFGVIALIGVFITISNIFIDSGFGNAIIQKKYIDKLDCSSIFYLNIAVSVLLYFIIYASAPYIAIFYDMPLVTSVLRVLAIQIVIMGFGCVQASLLMRNMKFKLNFIINFISTILSSFVGMYMAYNAYGVWSLVASQVIMQLSTVIGLWLLAGWYPQLIFSFARVKLLFSYSSKILGGALISVIYNNLYNLVIGKSYPTALLGYYNRGQLLPVTIIDNAASSLNTVLFPALSSIQNDKEKHLAIIRRSEKMVAFIVFFLATMMIALSNDIIYILLGEKWLPAVPFMQIVSMTACLCPIYILNQSIQTSLGRSDLYLKTTGFSRILAILLIFVCSYINVYVMVFAGTIANIMTIILTGRYNKQLIGYTSSMQFNDLIRPLCLSIIVGFVVYLFVCLGFNHWLNLFIGGGIGVVLYLSISKITKDESLLYIIQLLKK